jgi:hypothetical protein
MNIDRKEWFGRTGREGHSGNNQGRIGILSSLGSMVEFKPIDLSKSSGEAMKRDRHRGRRGWTGIARESLLPGEAPMRTLGASEQARRKIWRWI